MLAAFLTLAVALAGCTTNQANKAPEANLAVDHPTAWSGQPVSFDARDSKDMDGSIATYHFDFGDQQTADANQRDNAKVEHSYTHGGAYVATVVVTDNGTKDDAAKTDSATQRVVVNEREPIAAQTLYSTPANVSVSSTHRQLFDVYEHADHVVVTANITSVVLVGSSQLVVQVLAPDGKVLGEKTFDVPAGQTVKAELSVPLGDKGTYALDMKAQSGAMAVTGQLVSYYA